MTRRSTSLMTAVASLATISAGPAIAHPGPHHGMSFSELARHLASGWHLLTIGAALVVGAAAIMIAAHRRHAREQSGTRRHGGGK